MESFANNFHRPGQNNSNNWVLSFDGGEKRAMLGVINQHINDVDVAAGAAAGAGAAASLGTGVDDDNNDGPGVSGVWK